MPGRVPSLIVILALAGACRSAERAGSTVQVERDTIGDTSVVSTISGSIWGTEGRLEEELRIGLAEGAEEYVFGDVVELVPDGSGGVYIFDRQGPVLRHYDGTGRFMKTLGRQGGGPGEYRAIVGMGVRRDGRLMVHDAQNRRIAFYAPDGSPSGHWPVNSGLFIDRSLLVDSLDHTYIKAVTIEQPGDPAAPPWPIGLIHLDAEGRVVDTLYPPRIAGEPKSTGGPLAVAKTWELHPYGTVVGINRSYVFEIRRPNGTVTRIVRRHEPIPVSEGEWEAHEARRRWEIADEGLSPEHAEETPRTKPAYRSFHVAQDGRIWVRKYMPSVPIPVDGEVRQGGPPPFPFMEPAGFDVFEPDGDYLGHVGVPPRTTIHWFGTDLLYGIRRGENDEQYVVRLRLKTAT